MNQPSKPFNIDKRKVYEAYLRVKSNGGAAGVDAVTTEQFETDLKVIAHPSHLADQAAAGAKTARRLASGLRPARRPVATMDRRSA